MSQLKKLLGIKKKSRSTEHVAGADHDNEAGYTNVKEKDLSKLHKAAWNGDLARVKQVLNKTGKKGEDINQLDKQNRTALHLACVRGHLDVVAHLLAAKARTNLCDNAGKPPLIRAVECKQMRCVELLLEYGADINLVDLLGRGALHVAAQLGDASVVASLLERGARVDAQDKNGYTALHLSTEHGHSNIANYLLQEEAQINCTNKDGHTPLIIAARLGFVTLVHLFLNNRANTAVKDNQGYTAGDHALSRGNTQCSNLLRDYEPDVQNETSSARGMMSASGRRPSLFLGSQQESTGMRSGSVGVMFGGPAADEEDASAMTGEHSQVESARNLSPHSDTWHSSEESSLIQDTTSKPKPNFAERLFGTTSSEQTPPVGHAAAVVAAGSDGNAGKDELTVRTAKTWEAVDMGGTSEEDNGHQWMMVSSPPVRTSQVQQGNESRSNPGDSDFDSDDEIDNSELDAQVDAALTGTGPKILSLGQKQTSNSIPDTSNISDVDKVPSFSVSLPKPNSKHVNATPISQQSNNHAVNGGGLGIEYGNEEISSSGGATSDDDENVTELMDSFDQRRRESGSSHGHDFKSLKDPELGSKSSVKTSGSEKSGRSNGHRSQSNFAGGDTPKLVPMEQVDGKSRGQEGNDDNWDDDDNDDEPSTADKVGSKAVGDSNAVSVPLHTRYFQHSDDEDDDIEAMAAPTTSTQSRVVSQELKPQDKLMSSVTNGKATSGGLLFGSMTGDEEVETDSDVDNDNEVEKVPSRLTSGKGISLSNSRNLSQNVENLARIGMDSMDNGSLEKSVSEEASLTEESQGEWEDQQRRQREIDKQKAQRRVERDRGDHHSVVTAASDQHLKDRERGTEWEKERKEEERRERAEAADLLRKELEESNQADDHHSWDESISVEESPQVVRHEANQNMNSLDMEQSSSLVSEGEGDDVEKEQVLLEQEHHQLEQAQERILRSLSPLGPKRLPSIDQTVTKVTTLPLQSEISQADVLQEQENNKKLEREAIPTLEKRVLEAAKDTEQQQQEDKKAASWEEETERQQEEERQQRERKNREELEREAARMAEKQQELEARIVKERQQQEREEEERRKQEKTKREEAEKEQRRLEEKRVAEDKEWKQRLEDDERKLSEVKRQREAEQQRREAEMKERQEREEAERQWRLEEHARMTKEANERRKNEELRVKEMEERLKQQQEELRRMEVEARKRREEEADKWRKEQEQRREEEARRWAEEARKRQEEEQLWAEEQQRRREQQLAKLEEESRRRREEQERLIKEKREKSRQLEAKRIEETRKQHEDEMQFWRDEKERRQRDEVVSSASFRPSTAELENIAALRQPDGSSPQPPVTPHTPLLPAEKDVVPKSVQTWPNLDSLRDVSHSASLTSSIPVGEGELLRDVDDVGHSVGGESVNSSSVGSDIQPLEPRNYSSRLGHTAGSQLRSTSRQSVSVISPIHSSDPATAVRLNETLRETRRQLDKANAARSASEMSQREIQAELSDMRRKYDDVSKAKASIDRSRLDIEVEMRSLRYKYEQEQAVRQSSEVLLGQMKEQLARTEARLNQESQSRRDAELTRRNAEIELRGTQTTTQQLERQIDDMKLQLTRERDRHALKEEAYSEQLKLHQELQYEANQTLEQKVLVQNNLKSSNETCQELRELLNSTQAELQTTKQQGDIDRRQYKEQVSAFEVEIDSLREKLQEKEDIAVATESELVEIQQKFEAHESDLQSKIALLDAALDRENGARQAAEMEANSLKARLSSKSRELEHSLNVNQDMERAYQQEQERWKQEQASLQHAITQNREASQTSNLQLNTVQTKLQSLEKELQSARLQLAERGGQLAAHGKESEVRQQQVFLLEDRLRQEKESNGQLTTKLEAVTERVTNLQGEAQFLRQQLDGANNKLLEKDRAAQETQDKFTLMLNSLRSDAEKSKNDGDERSRELLQQVVQLKEELARNEGLSHVHKKEMKRLQQELNESERKHASCEGSLSEVSKALSRHKKERAENEKTIVQLQSKITLLEVECSDSKHQVSTLTDRLSDMERAGKESLYRLETAVSESALLTKSKGDLERCVGQMSEERHELEAALNAEKEKTLQLREELVKGDQIRARLESRVNDLKGDTNDLDEQLKETKSAHSLALQEAEEARGLWETEVKSRSKLGMKLLELEKNQTHIRSTVDNEKKRTRHALEMRRAADYKVDALHDRNSELQEEVSTLRGQLKAAKKRLRDLEASDSRISTLRAEFSQERSGLENSMKLLQQQLDQTRRQAVEEGDRRRRIQHSCDKTKDEFISLKNQAAVSERREREHELMCRELQRANRSLEEELMRMKALIGTDFINRGEMEAYRKDVESKARAELNKKLEEVNSHLEEQSLARNNMEKSRIEAESRMRLEHEKSTTDLKTEVTRLRSSVHDAQVKLETANSEAKRYKCGKAASTTYP
ncbi:trichohyalin-like isoform X2 [Corticium candelabrum]|uniref:trichohyalin-like isoform X2 n=1 Tax=Corticium candelabrum TaxID=121492 RepID=UPI002E257609|nr:trichohyalin-like isoform X2 [Corticium candelabrum]